MARKVLHVRLGGGEVPANGTSVRSDGPELVPQRTDFARTADTPTAEC